MNARDNIRNINVCLKGIRGWLPKEPRLPTLQLENKPKKLFNKRNAFSISVGVIVTMLLTIGLAASFYQVTRLAGSPPFIMWWQIVYPYRNVGIILLLAGIVFTGLGFLLPFRIIQHPKISSLEIRSKAWRTFGVVFLGTGLGASYFQWTQLSSQAPFISSWQIFYPNGNVGIILLGAGIVFMAVGFLLPQKTTQKISRPPQA
jgi:hypothetical protein